MDKDHRVELLLTGNELMSGDTVDTNSAMLAQHFEPMGFRIARKTTLGDELDSLIDSIVQLSQNAAVLLINGGLGPTRDDLTALALATAAGVPLVEHPEAKEHVESWCARRSLPINGANLKQAQLPQGAEIVANPVGSAVGFTLALNGCLVIATPGVPSELRAMAADVTERIVIRLGARTRQSTLRLQTFGLGESPAQQRIDECCPDWPAEVSLGFRASSTLLELKLTVADRNQIAAQQACRATLYELFGDYILGEGDVSMAQSVVDLLRARQQRVCTAESCTGGQIASLLTQIPGSSAIFHAGLVAYSNSVKHSLLGVDKQLLEEHGAVSEPVVLAMAEGALRLSQADYAIAVSGIAGPDGGTAEKPVGTVWLAWGSLNNLQTTCLLWPAPRQQFQRMIAHVGLDLLRRELRGLTASTPLYMQLRRHPSARVTGSI